MKLQGFSIVFALVCVPLLLVLGYYIQLQVDTITLQNQYDTKLLDSTYDALAAFEINTANEDLSTVSDSLRTIIEASNNLFFNTLSTNLGLSNASKAYVEPYIPAILYTLYDGYYIYAPTQVPEVLTDVDCNAISVGDVGVDAISGSGLYSYTETGASDNVLKYSDTELATDYGQLLYKTNEDGKYTTNVSNPNIATTTKNVLKSYMPYSAQYKHEAKDASEKDLDITVVYTLDNYVTIRGTIDGNYYNESGYLIPEDSVEITLNDGSTDITKYNQNDAQKYIEDNGNCKITIRKMKEDGSGVEYEDSQFTIDALSYYDNVTNFSNISQFNKKTLEEQLVICSNNMGTGIYTVENYNKIQYRLDEISAAVYYTKAKIFTNWVKENLSCLVEKDCITDYNTLSYTTENETEDVYHDFKNSDTQVFELKGSNQKNGITEIDQDSPFYTHKLNVIRNSIQYNLNLAMSTYNMHKYYGNDKSNAYAMPVMSNQEWEQILSNISIVSFMQGWDCGLKTYNNYMVVSSSNNEIITSDKNIFYVPTLKFDNQSDSYHRIDCPKLIQNSAEGYASFSSKEVKYDKIYNKTESEYVYDHRNLACYDCINDSNYEHNAIFDNSDANYANYGYLRKAYYIAVGKERNNVYKMNAVEDSNGYEIIYNKYGGNTYTGTSKLKLDKIKSIEIVFGTVPATDINETVLNYKVSLNGVGQLKDGAIYSIPTNSTKEYTWKVEVDPTKTSTKGVEFGDFVFENQANPSTGPENNVKFKECIKFIRVIYK